MRINFPLSIIFLSLFSKATIVLLSITLKLYEIETPKILVNSSVIHRSPFFSKVTSWNFCEPTLNVPSFIVNTTALPERNSTFFSDFQ